MRLRRPFWILVPALVLGALFVGLRPLQAWPAPSGAPARALGLLDRLPVAFEENRGQEEDAVRFRGRSPGVDLYLLEREAVLHLGGRNGASTVVRLRPLGAARRPRLVGEGVESGRSHYLVGSDPRRWRREVRRFAAVRYEALYPGIDLAFHGSPRQLEYDFRIAPGAAPSRIRLAFEGAQSIAVGPGGELVVETGAGRLVQPPPDVYQEIGGVRRPIAGRYRVRAGRGPRARPEVGFALGAYDPGQPVVIDPILSFATYLGGTREESGPLYLKVDAAGNVYVAGSTQSADFPGVGGRSVQGVFGSSVDAFVTKIDPTGSRIVYSTYYGGPSWDYARGLAVDGAGSVYLVGRSGSDTLPGVGGTSLQLRRAGGDDAFIAKFDPRGSNVIYATFLGGAAFDDPVGVAVDGAGQAVVVGETFSPAWPGVDGRSFQTVHSSSGSTAFVTKLNAAGDDFVFSTYYGTIGFPDFMWAVASDAAGNTYLAGEANSLFLPGVDARSIQSTKQPFPDAFVSKLDPQGKSVVWATYLGGAQTERARAIVVDATGQVYVTGQTQSVSFFGAERSPIQARIGGGYDAFVAKIDASGSRLIYSTYLGGSQDDFGMGIVADAAGNAYVTGTTRSPDLPGVGRGSIQSTFGGGPSDAFVAGLDPQGRSLLFATYFGGRVADTGEGVGVDAAGRVTITGTTDSSDLPGVTERSLQRLPASPLADAFVAQILAAPAGACAAGDATLCLDDQAGDQRYEVRLHYETSQGGGRAGDGHPISLQPIGLGRGGLLSFFGTENPEMLVKVVPGCGVNGKHWLFASATTNLGWTLTVRDTRTGESKAYVSPDGTAAAPIQDVGALACAADEANGAEAALGAFAPARPEPAGPAEPGAPVVGRTSACFTNGHTLCLAGRYRVEVDYQTAQGGGTSGPAQAIALDSLGVGRGGLYWFFAPDNPEMLVKVLDGCAVNQKLWVFLSAGTNVGYTVTVTDTQTDHTATYRNGVGTPAVPVQDTSALPCGG